MTKAHRILAAMLFLTPVFQGQVYAQQQEPGEQAVEKKALLNGFRRYHSSCNHCHGPDGMGSTFGPALVDAPPDPDRFRDVVLNGVKGQTGVMKGFAGDPNITEHLDDILAYIDARARGDLGRGRPR